MAFDTESKLIVAFEGLTDEFNGRGKNMKDEWTSNIEDWTIDSSYLRSSDSFSFTFIDENPENLRNLECQPVSLHINGARQLMGRIDQTVRGDKGMAVTCNGRDYVSDLVECNIDPTFVVKEGETLGSVIVRAASPVGIKKVADGSDIAAARNVRTGKSVGGPGEPPNFISFKQEDLKPDPGQGIFEFLKKICERHGCTIQPSTSRDELLVAGPFYKQEVAYKIARTRSNTTANNIDSATATRDYSSFPSLVMVQGQGSPRHGEATKSNQATLDTWDQTQKFGGELARTINDVTWTGRRKPNGNEGDIIAQHKIYRLNYFRDNQARNATQLARAAQKLLAEHLKNTLIYDVILNGHIDPVTGAVWSIDTLIQVDDDICDVHEQLWVMERSLSFGSQGAKTKLKCIRPGSFEI